MKRWYDYSSPANKLGTIYFETAVEDDGPASRTVKCTTEIAYRVLGESEAWHVQVEDPSEHQRLMEFFFRELLAARGLRGWSSWSSSKTLGSQPAHVPGTENSLD